MAVKIYGSPLFAPGDLPAGTTLQREWFSDGVNSLSGQEIWAGCLGSGCVPPGVGIGYSDTMWRTATAWSFGGYGTSAMLSEEQGNDCNAPPPAFGSAGCLPGSLQDSQSATGWNSFLNGAGANKRLVIRVGGDLPAGSVINYVRVYIRGGSFSGGTKYLQPYWEVVDMTGSSGFPAVSSGKTWDTPQKFAVSPSTYSVSQQSSKWTTAPVSGQAWTPALMQTMAWGVRHGRSGEDGNPGSGTINVSEMAIEVGYDAAAQYAVTTGPAIGVTGTTATLTGTVNPFSDPSGSWFFQYGTTMSLGTDSPLVPQPSATTYDIALNIAGLSPDTEYFYRAAAQDSTGTFHYGQILSFITVSNCSTRASLVGG